MADGWFCLAYIDTVTYHPTLMSDPSASLDPFMTYKTLLLKKTFDFHTTPTPRKKRRFHPKIPILLFSPIFLNGMEGTPEQIRGWGF